MKSVNRTDPSFLYVPIFNLVRVEIIDHIYP